MLFRIIFSLFFLGGAFFVIWFLLSLREQNRVKKELGRLMSSLENAYEEFFKKRVTLSLLETKSPEEHLPQIEAEALEVLLPDYLALLTYVEEVEMGGLSFPKPSKVFQQLQTQLSVFLDRKKKKTRSRLSTQDKEKLETTYKACINSDLRLRLINLKTSDLV
ncbi:MAG: hypothetical protein AAGC85_05275 [Bacteroidota bacterium]